MYQIAGPFVWGKEEGGTGTRFNIGESVPEELIKNKKVLERLLKSRRIVLIDDVTGKQVITEHSLMTIADEDIAYIAKNMSWKAVIDHIATKDFSIDSLTKLKTAISLNTEFAQRETTVQAIDNRIKELKDKFGEVKDGAKKNTNS